MKKLIVFTTAILLFNYMGYAQERMLEIEGAIQIADSDGTSSGEGTIRFNTNTKDFEGWNGTEWVSLTAGKQFVKDIDKNSYEIVTIGTQTWMTENLRTSRFNDGTAIPLGTNSTEWYDLVTPGYTRYDKSYSETPDYVAPEYGALYNWYAVADTNSHNICPTGWHVPTDMEWTTLVDYLDPGVVDPNIFGIQSTVSGGKMKESGIAHWNAPNISATNESGFFGLPGGSRFHTIGIDFGGFGTDCLWWSSTGTLFRSILVANGDIYRGPIWIRAGLSVRCLKD
jgi:uncharacterized protein (TIGR02145 family)